jgi:hypothetical protein
MVPRTRDEWTLDAITQLLIKGYKEPESFDFKESLPHKSNIDKKIDLLKDCCAFANSSGGFLVFGVTDDVSAPLEDRLKGISTKEFLVDFGNFPSQCIPSIRWDFRTLPFISTMAMQFMLSRFLEAGMPPIVLNNFAMELPANGIVSQRGQTKVMNI